MDYLKKIYKLLRPGADATITDDDGNGAFHYLVQNGDMFRRPAVSGKPRPFAPPRPSSPVDDPSMTMEGLIHRLQAAGADINLQNKNGETPLHFLCRSACSDKKWDERLCENLCRAGADLNIRDRQGRSAAFTLFLKDPRNPWNRNEGEHLCQFVSRLGARFDTQDNHGRTVLHCLLSGKDVVTSSLVAALAHHGVDASAVDDDGNTLWHAAVEGGNLFSDLLLRLGADPQKPNNSGRNPLHYLSSLQAPRPGLRLEIFPACIPDQQTTAFDSMLEIYPENGYDLDSRDNQGITPLHLTCTFSEYQAGRLLQAGADPKIPTNEGLTPLHLAARCRQSNIIGLLLENPKGAELDAEGQRSSSIHEIINAKDACGKSPLYYACASGRADSVALLLDAGASVQSDAFSGSVWQACAEFEEEQLNWNSPLARAGTLLTASGVLVGDKKRPTLGWPNKFPREHLEDVLRLLLQRQDAPGVLAGFLEEAIFAAAAKQLDYTAGCLVQARESLSNSLKPGTAIFSLNESTSACLARFNAFGITENASLSPQTLRAEFGRLMGLRRHDLVQTLILEHGWGELDGDGNTFIHNLVRNGLVSVLRGLTPLVRELSKRLEDVEWCGRQKLASSEASSINYFPWTTHGNLNPGFVQPLLLTACGSEYPNMEVLKFLVEEIGCDVNVQGYLRVPIRETPTGFGICRHETPIHTLCRGETHWWQGSQALQYLARDHSADLEIKDCFRSTPLAVALSHIGRVTFNRGTVNSLLEFGADVRAVDLTVASNNAEMTGLLLSRGAVLKPATLLAAVRGGNCDVLNTLISHGGDVNARETSTSGNEIQVHPPTPIFIETTAPPKEMIPRTAFERHLQGTPHKSPGDKDTYTTDGLFVLEEQMYPLDYAARLYARQPELDEMLRSIGNKYDEVSYTRTLPVDQLQKVIETLVARGADVMAAYEFPGGVRMSIKDRIVLRGRQYGIFPLHGPELTRKILELCKTSYEGEM